MGALVVNNALGDVHARDGRPLVTHDGSSTPPPLDNTTLVVVATDAPLDRAQGQKLAELAHDALALSIRPAHTMFDGDVVFVLGTGAAGAAEAGFMRSGRGRRCDRRGDRAQRPPLSDYQSRQTSASGIAGRSDSKARSSSAAILYVCSSAG